MKENNRISGFLIFTLLFALILAAIVSFTYFSVFSINFKLSTDQEVWAWFGDYLGGILSPIFAFAALIALLYSIHLQNNELRNSTKQLAESAEALKKQNNLIQKQNMEVTFFQLLKLYNEIVDGLELMTDKNNPDLHNMFHKRDCIKFLLSEIHALYKQQDIDPNKDLTDLKSNLTLIDSAYDKFMQKYDYLIEHYIRTIYNILKFIDIYEIPDEEKLIYRNFLRAQLSKYEIGLLFYTAICKRGRKKILPLSRKYDLFKHLENEVLILQNDRSLMDESY